MYNIRRVPKRRRTRRRRSSELNSTSKLQQELDRIIGGIEAIKGKTQSLDCKVKDMRENIMQEKRYRQHRGGLQATAYQQRRCSTQSKLLSEHVQQTKKKCSMVESMNTSSKQEVDSLRRERLVMNDIMAQLQKEFEDKKEKMARMIAHANQLYLGRLDASSKRKKLERQEGVEHEMFKREYKALNQTVQHFDQIQASIEQAHLHRKAGDLKKAIDSGKLDPEEVGKLKAKLHVLESKVSSGTRNKDPGYTRFHSLEKAFQKIHRETGLINVSEIVQRFIDTDDDIFLSFNQVQELDKVTAGLSVQYEHYQHEINTYMNDDHSASVREKIRKESGVKLSQVQTRLVAMQAHAVKQRSSFHIVQQIIERLRSSFKTSQDDATALGSQVTQNNIMQWLGKIENHAGELITTLQRRATLNPPQRGKPSEGQGKVACKTRTSQGIEDKAFAESIKEKIDAEQAHRKKKVLPLIGPGSPVRRCFSPVIEVEESERIAGMLQVRTSMTLRCLMCCS